MTEHTTAIEPYPLNPMFASACQFGHRGLRLLPVEHHTRTAILPQWQINASNEVPFIDKHFASGHNNIGLCCGPQPQGWNILCVDVDNQETWKALEAEYGPIDRTSLCFHRTPSGGLHLFFDVPANMAVTGTDVFGDGIDARGGHAGNVGCGYVLLPPSVAPSKESGELLPYGVSPGKGLLDRPPGPAPKWLLEMINAHLNPPKAAIQASINRHPSGLPFASDDPWTYVREHYSWPEYLLKHRWLPAGGQYWTRPDKSVREGHSAQLHDDGRLAIWTGEIPNEIRDLGSRQVDGGVSISLADFITAYEFGGDRAAFGRHIRTQVMPAPPRRAVPTAPAEPDSTSPYLSAEVWDSFAWTQHVLAAAQSQGVGPMALLAHVLVRASALIPPCWQMRLGDSVISTTFDFLAVVAAETGMLKTVTAQVAEALIPDPYSAVHPDDRPVVMGYSPGTGEGIAQAFLVPERVEDPETGKTKLTGRQVQSKIMWGLHLLCDEGVGFIEQAGRSGATIIATMCSAWSGSALGQLNAKAENKRLIRARSVRVSAILNIQASNAYKLFSEYMQTIGLTGRVLFADTRNPDAPEVGDRPPWPGALPFDPPPGGFIAPAFMDFDPSIVAQIISRGDAKLRGHLIVASQEGQHEAMLMKIAGVTAILDGSTGITQSHWAFAEAVMATNRAMFDRLTVLASSNTTRRSVAAAVARGDVESEALTVRENRRLLDFTQRLRETLKERGPQTRKELKNLAKATDRPLLWRALDGLVSSGVVDKSEDGKHSLST